MWFLICFAEAMLRGENAEHFLPKIVLTMPMRRISETLFLLFASTGLKSGVIHKTLPPATCGCRYFGKARSATLLTMLLSKLLMADAVDCAFDEGYVYVAGCGVDVDAVDFAYA